MGGGRHPEVEVRKLLSDDVISLDDIQKLISKAHSDNIKNGLFYATASQTIEKLTMVFALLQKKTES
jgi:hypothetical protein